MMFKSWIMIKKEEGRVRAREREERREEGTDKQRIGEKEGQSYILY